MIRSTPAAVPTTPAIISQCAYGLVCTSRAGCDDDSMAARRVAPAPRA
ncbi:hypothetical protein AB0B57_14755 [Micromonospora sp. NPDC049101]